MTRQWIIAIALMIVSILSAWIVSAHAAEKQVMLAWEQEISPGFAGWSLYHSPGNGTFSHFANIAYQGQEQDTYSVSKIINTEDVGKSHCFYMTARNDEGEESAPSNTACATLDYPTPSIPVTLTITVEMP